MMIPDKRLTDEFLESVRKSFVKMFNDIADEEVEMTVAEFRSKLESRKNELVSKMMDEIIITSTIEDYGRSNHFSINLIINREIRR